MKIRIRHVIEDMDRHGNVRIYLRRKGQRKVRLPGPIGSPEFLAAYQTALKGESTPHTQQPGQPSPGSLRWLCVQYYRSASYQQLDPRTQKIRRSILERLCHSEGNKPVKQMAARHIRERRDAIADRPEAANGMIKALRQVFSFAVEYGHLDRNLARDVDYIRTGSQGFHSWTPEEIARFEEYYPIGTTARLALALALYTAQRRSDLVRFGKQHIQHDGEKRSFVFTQYKGRKRNPIRLQIPIVSELQRVIDAGPTGDLTLLVNAFGHPFTSNGFGNRFRKWCDEAGLPRHCSVHGLRKAAAARLAELGCTEREIMAITGHTTSKEVNRYTRAASQKELAESALRHLVGERK